MSSSLRMMLCLMVLISSPDIRLPGPYRCLAASTRGSLESPDEAALRNLTEQYGRAITSGDVAAMSQFWNPRSPNLASRLGSYRILFRETRLEFIDPRVTRIEIMGDRAVSNLTADERHLDNKTGCILTTYDILHGACRSIEWVKTDHWRVQREVLVQDELAARLDAAASEQQRDELLEKENVFVTNALVRAMGFRGLHQHQVRGDYDGAWRCYQLQQALAEKIGDPLGMAGTLMNTAILKRAQQDYEHGLPLARKALALFEAAGSTRGVTFSLEKLSSLYRSVGDLQQAFDCAQKSLRMSEEMNHRRAISAALSELAIVYANQNNPRQALAYMERALAIARDLSDIILIATLEHDQAIEFKNLGDYPRSLEIYRELLKQIEESGDQEGAAMIRDQIGSLLAAQGKYSDALVYHRQALAALDAANHISVPTLINLSVAYLGLGQYAEALPFAERAVRLARQTGRQIDLWSALTDLGYCHLGLLRYSEARQAFAEAVSIMEKLRTQTAGGADEQERYFEGALRAHHGLLRLLVGENQIEEALVLAERAKARVLLDVLQQGRVSIHKAMTSDEQAQERQLTLELARLNTQLTASAGSVPSGASGTDGIKSRLEKARLNYEDFRNSLYTAHPELRVQRGESPVINRQELIALLPGPTSALLEYVVSDDITYLFCITRGATGAGAEVRVYTLPIQRDDLGKRIEDFRQGLAGRDLGFREPSARLYELLLKPAEAQLNGKTDLVIAPDDVLWDLPFQALLTGRGRFLIENAAIAYAPSLTVLREMTRRRQDPAADPASPTLLALGNPLLGKETISRAALNLRDAKLDPLPEAEQEVKALGRLYGASRSKVYIGAEAREDRVKTEASQARVIHFATHGMLNNASPMYSHLVLAPGSAKDDGLLEAWELMQLDLKADLAVLSACETARGRIGAGEGMIGLSWAMFIAGVPTTVVSQWRVEAAGTRDLMVNFHRTLITPPRAGSAKPTKSEALRQAALRVMQNPEMSHPFYWAGFIMVGDGR